MPTPQDPTAEGSYESRAHLVLQATKVLQSGYSSAVIMARYTDENGKSVYDQYHFGQLSDAMGLAKMLTTRLDLIDGNMVLDGLRAQTESQQPPPEEPS